MWGAGVLTLDESKAIERGLDAVAERLEDGEAPTSTDEDVHTLIDRLLHEEIGEGMSAREPDLAVGADGKDGRRLGAGKDVAEEQERRLVRPVEVVEHEQER